MMDDVTDESRSGGETPAAAAGTGWTAAQPGPSGAAEPQRAPGPPPGWQAGPPPGWTPPPLQQRRLVRRMDDRMIAGVASGVGAYLAVDPLLVRIVFVALSFAGGVGFIAYLAAWLLVPRSDGGEPAGLEVVRRLGSGRGRARMVVGGILLVAAIAVLGDTLNIHHDGLFWGVALVALGVVLLVEETWPFSGPVGAASAASQGTATTHGAPASGAWYWAGGYGTSAYAPVPPVAAPPFGGAQASPAAGAPQTGTAHPLDTTGAEPPSWSPPPGAPAPGWAVPRAAGVRRRSVLGWVTVATALLALGVAALLDNAGVISLSLAGGFALALIVIGAGLLVGTWYGRSRGLALLGIAILPFAVASSLVRVPISGGAGDRAEAPTSVAGLQSDYRLGAGRLEVDLSAVDLHGATVSVTASVTVGELTVVVPPGAGVTVHAQAGAGEVDLLGHIDNGAQVDTSLTDPGGFGGGSLHLDAGVGFGHIRVVRAPASASASR